MDVKIFRTNPKRKGHISGFIFETRKHTLILVMFIILFSGLITGNFTVMADESVSDSVGDMFSLYIDSVEGLTFRKCFFQNFTVNSVMLLINFIFGLCAVGFPIPLMSLFIKGFSIGLLSKYMYEHYALKGFGYCVLVIYPVQIAISMILIKTSKISVRMSVSLLKTLTNRNKTDENNLEFQRYIAEFLIQLVMCAILSLASVLLTVYITKFFNF